MMPQEGTSRAYFTLKNSTLKIQRMDPQKFTANKNTQFSLGKTGTSSVVAWWCFFGGAGKMICRNISQTLTSKRGNREGMTS